jgi:hypothetical protein
VKSLDKLKKLTAANKLLVSEIDCREKTPKLNI